MDISNKPSSSSPQVGATPNNTPSIPAPIERSSGSGSGSGSGSSNSSSSGGGGGNSSGGGGGKGGGGGGGGSGKKAAAGGSKLALGAHGAADNSIQVTPEMASAIQAKLESLVGAPSGYVETLPAEVRRRINALKNLQHKHSELEVEFREEILALEAKYLTRYEPLYLRRRDIVNGGHEPNDEECQRDSDEEGETEATIEELEDEMEGAAIDDSKKAKGGGKSSSQKKKQDKKPDQVKGIPEFWLTTMKNHPYLQELVTEKDEGALRHLEDITLSYTDNNHGFVLEFFFSPNEFFTNSSLTKTYYLQNNAEAGYDDLVFSHSVGCAIQWKKDKNLTVKIESKKQRHKGTKKTRTVKREVPAESFFHFFAPPAVPADPEERDEFLEQQGEEIQEKLEQDFELGEMFKTKLVPHAVDWFTGSALQYEDDDEDYEDEDAEEDDEDDEHLDDDDDGDDSDVNPSSLTQQADKPEECKQQ